MDRKMEIIERIRKIEEENHGRGAIYYQNLESGETWGYREYWDSEKETRGIHNFFVPEEMGQLLKKMYDRTLAEDNGSIEKVMAALEE